MGSGLEDRPQLPDAEADPSHHRGEQRRPAEHQQHHAGQLPGGRAAADIQVQREAHHHEQLELTKVGDAADVAPA